MTEQFATCRFACRCEILDADLRTDKRDHLAVARGGGSETSVTSMARRSIDGCPTTGHRRPPTIACELVVESACRSRIAIRVSDRNQRKPRRPLCGPANAIGDGFPRRQAENLHDASVQFDHREHRIVGAWRGINAVKRRTRSHEIEMGLRSDEDAGRIGQ